MEAHSHTQSLSPHSEHPTPSLDLPSSVTAVSFHRMTTLLHPMTIE